MTIGRGPQAADDQLGQLGRWMSCEGLGPSELNAARVEAFLAARRAAGHQRVPTMRGFWVLLEYPTDEHVIPHPPDEAVPGDAVDGLVAVYRDWLVVRLVGEGPLPR